MRRPVASISRLIMMAALLALWEWAAVALQMPAYILPTPSKIAYAMYNGIASNLYPGHLAATVGETILGFIFGCMLAFTLGTIVALSRTVEYFLYPIIIMFQAMPKVALAPLIIVWCGLGLTSKVGLRSADEDRVNLMRSLSASRWQIFRMLQLPNAMPYIFAGLEIAMIFSLIGAIVAELLGAEKGLGMLITSMNFTMDVAGQFSILLILAALGLILNGAVTLVRRRVLFWDPSRDGEIGQPITKGDVL